MVADKYTIQAETLMKAAIEDYTDLIQEVKSSDANLTTLKGIRINIQGKPRRLVDVGDIKKTENENVVQILRNMFFNFIIRSSKNVKSKKDNNIKFCEIKKLK